MRTERHGTWGCVLAVVAVVASGCSSGAAAPPDPPATGSTSIARATTGTISGVVRLYGGPYGRVVEPGGQTRTGQALNGNPGPNEQFFVSSASGERFSAKSNAQGNFSLTPVAGQLHARVLAETYGHRERWHDRSAGLRTPRAVTASTGSLAPGRALRGRFSGRARPART